MLSVKLRVGTAANVGSPSTIVKCHTKTFGQVYFLLVTDHPLSQAVTGARVRGVVQDMPCWTKLTITRQYCLKPEHKG